MNEGKLEPRAKKGVFVGYRNRVQNLVSFGKESHSE